MQALMIAVTQQWGMIGFQEHCSKMQQVYQHRANIMHQAALRVCPTICPTMSYLHAPSSPATLSIIRLLELFSPKLGCTSVQCTLNMSGHLDMYILLHAANVTVSNPL